MKPNGRCLRCGFPARVDNVDVRVEEEGRLPRPPEVACTNPKCGSYKPGAFGL